MLVKDITKHNIFWRKEVSCPVTNQNVIIFPFSFRALEFITNFYTPEMTDNQLQTQQIESFIEEIQLSCNYFTLLRTWDTFFLKVAYWAVTIGLILVFAFEKSYPKIALILFIITLGLGGMLLFYNVARVPWIFSNYRKKILGLIKYSNDTYFKAMGMRLELSPKNFDWIELWLEYRTKNEPNRIIFNDNGDNSKKFYTGTWHWDYPYLSFFRFKAALPPSTDNSIVFPFDYRVFDFKYSFYNSDMSKNVISYQQVEDFFRGLKNELEDYGELSGRVKWEIVTLVIQSFLILLAVIAGIYVPSDFLDGHKILMMLGCFFAPSIVQLYRREMRDECMNSVRDAIERYILMQNYDFKKNKVRWVLSKTQVDYIEMWHYENLTTISGPSTDRLDVSFGARTEEDESPDTDNISLLRK